MLHSMRISRVGSLLACLFAAASGSVSAFSLLASQQQQQRSSRVSSSWRLYSQSTTEQSSLTTETTTELQGNVQSEMARSKPKTKTLGLITFDLDDTLYPLSTVIAEANAAFARAMTTFGYPGIAPDDIDTTSAQIRKRNGAAALLSHTEIRKLAIRENMERVMLRRKLQDCAEDWATNVESLGPVVVASAKRWSAKSVSPSVVDAVLTAWEMERHHAAERHLYPEVLPALDEIKKQYPNVVIGAVTDGKANPLFMTFTLAKYFDFCASWEDDQGARRKFFQELSKVEGNAELSWIYNTAKEKAKDIADAHADIAKAGSKTQVVVPEIGSQESVWIHVGDDLAYDVGGSSQCGAKTILVELADKYGQTARHRFDPTKPKPAWSVNTEEELAKRAILNEAAKEHVNERLEYWHLLPELVNKIVDEAGTDGE